MRRDLSAARAVAVSFALAAITARGGEIDRSGIYRLQGRARVAAQPLMNRDVDVNADAVLQPGPGPSDVRARLAAEGYACDLLARIDGDGALAFPEGQRCDLEVRSPDARGHLEATLRSGRGQLRNGEELELELAWEVAGRLSVRADRAIEVLGTRVDVPATWMLEAPVRGNARATVSGRRDRSRAAER